MPSAGAPADPTARGFLQHVREHAFAFEDEPASDASRGNAGGPGMRSLTRAGTAAGGSAGADAGGRRAAAPVRGGGGRKAVGFPGGGRVPWEPMGKTERALIEPPPGGS